MKRLLLLALLAVAGCGSGEGQQESSRTPIGYGASIYTFSHDGHKFVVLDTDNGNGIVHHPDCPCMKKAERE